MPINITIDHSSDVSSSSLSEDGEVKAAVPSTISKDQTGGKESVERKYMQALGARSNPLVDLAPSLPMPAHNVYPTPYGRRPVVATSPSSTSSIGEQNQWIPQSLIDGNSTGRKGRLSDTLLSYIARVWGGDVPKSPQTIELSNDSLPQPPPASLGTLGSDSENGSFVSFSDHAPSRVYEPSILSTREHSDLYEEHEFARGLMDCPDFGMYGNTHQSRFFGRLVDIIKKLECERDVLQDHIKELKQHLSRPPQTTSPEEPTETRAEDLPPRLLVVHQVRVQYPSRPSIFLDPPRMFAGDSEDQTLRGQLAVRNLDSYLRMNSDISFVVRKEYDQETYRSSLELLPKKFVAGKELLLTDPPEPKVASEYIMVVSKPLEAALAKIAKSHPDRIFNNPKTGESIPVPYLFIYHHRSQATEYVESAEGGRRAHRAAHVGLLFRHVLERHGEEYNAADALFSSGLVSGRHLLKLFRPNEIIVTRMEQDNIGLEIANWPRERQNSERLGQWDSGEMKLETVKSMGVELGCNSWTFNGLFHKNSRDISVTLSESNKPCPITELEAYPLRFADPSVRSALLNRGKEFWKCRYRRFVSYDGWDAMREEHNIDTRFMIDYNTYRNMHSAADAFSKFRDPINTLGLKEMAREVPSDNSILLMLPANIDGFNLQEKKWVKLAVDRISNVRWNKKAFERLVIDPNIKELVNALVSVHTATHKNPARERDEEDKKLDSVSADLMSGKGNGLIILLHGGPGTGKTLTAESVAELSERPLYRVTCGDIGTEVEAAEKYLESILFLGRKWGCVVLLDEADVFLEERTLADMKRNALVSVFLRVLEYYEGILILTSNRVGTFDEAFKSRIQLAIHYPSLSTDQRLKIWHNFFKILSENNVSANIADLEDNAEELAKVKLNGRQIRNVITASRQLAQHRGQILDNRQIKQVMQAAQQFEDYLQRTHGHSDEEYARDERLRHN